MTKLASALALLCSLAGVAPAQGGPVHLDLAAAKRALGAAKRELAPDRRTVVFDVSIRASGDLLELTGEVHSAALEQRLLAHLRAAGAGSLRSELTILPSAEVGERTFGVVSLSVANLRSKPGHSQELVQRSR